MVVKCQRNIRLVISGNTETSVAKSISDTLKKNLYSKLSDSPFSLSMDSSSDVNEHTYLTICAKYLDPENLETPSTKLLFYNPNYNLIKWRNFI